jgi:hypothetical protein
LSRFLDSASRRFISRIERIASTREDWEIVDERLSDGQLHYMVTSILKNEPLVVAAALLYKAGRPGSKVDMPIADQARLALMISDRLYGPVSVKAKRAAANANQFELQFAWDDATGERHRLTATGDIE